MKKLIASVILAAGVLVAMPVWSGNGHNDRHYSQHQDRHYVKHGDRHSRKHKYEKHGGKRYSHASSYGYGRGHYKKHHAHNRHYYPSSYRHSYSPYRHDSDSHWGIVLRYFD